MSEEERNKVSNEYIEKQWYSETTQNINEVFSVKNWKLDLLDILKGDK